MDTSLSKYFAQAKAQHWAIGHFNFATADVLHAIVQGAHAAGAPCVMVGTSPGEAQFLGLLEAAALVEAVREATQYPVFLNADHFKSYDACKAAIDAGYDTVLYDGGRVSYELNVIETRRVLEYAQVKRPGMMIEGELGYLKGSSEVQKSVDVSSADYTKPEQAADFVRRTGVQRLAVVFGNIHGIVTQQEEKLDIGRLKDIAAAVPDVHLVLHGASGLPDDQVAAAIAAGVTNVHFNTELRVAYATSIANTLREHPEEATTYKILAPAAEKVRELVKAKCHVFMAPSYHD